MKIDRMLSIIVLLINRNLVSAKELSDRFEVSVRTIQRDMDSINLAGIPVTAVQGPHGGYSILDTYKIDRQLMSMDDLYYIITALKGIGTSLDDNKIENTIEKITSLVPHLDDDPFHERNERLHIDFSMLGGNEQQRRAFRIVQKAVDSGRLLNFRYTNNRLETLKRTVEPMTVVFRWRSWYLFAWCRTRADYRIFRISKIREPEILAGGFKRRNKSYKNFAAENDSGLELKTIDISIKFDNIMKPLLEDYYSSDQIQDAGAGHFIVDMQMPEDGWLYGYILSFGEFAEVLSPPHLIGIIKGSAEKIIKIYE